MRKWLVIGCLLIALPWGGWRLFVLDINHLSFTPEAMEVSSVLHVSERAEGVGPGANETGIIVYEMPEAVARALEDDAIAYLRTSPPNSGAGWRGKYADWAETPVGESWRWNSPAICGGKFPFRRCTGITDYLFRSGFTIPLDEKIVEMVDTALYNAGAFYAFGRIGLIILIPEARRIVYAYRG